MFHDNRHIITGPARIVWDGITRPGKNDAGQVVHNIKVAIAPGSPELAELQKIATDSLNADTTMKGALPPGGNWPLVADGAAQIDPSLVGFILINAKTYQGAPQVFDINGRILDPMAYSSMLYAGATVKLLVHAYSFTNVSKGVAFGIDGIQIIDATTPKFAIAGIDASAAFGGSAAAALGTAFSPPAAPGAVAPPPAATPPPAAPGTVAPAPDFLNPATPPAAPGAPSAPPAPVGGPPVGFTMTAKAAGATYESFIANKWTDAAMVQSGYMVDDIPF